MHRSRYPNSLSILVLWGATASFFVPALHAQSPSVTTCVVDPNPTAEGDALEKTAGYFTHAQNTGVPDIVIGHGNTNGPGGMDIYVANSSSPCGGWSKYHIGNGDFYERSKPILFPGNKYADLIISVSQKVLLFHNPLNQGGATVNKLWATTVINPSEGCHDLRLQDLDGDGLQDVVCSASALRNNSPPFLAFQNQNGSWSVTHGSGIVAGDSIATLSINGGPQNNVVACDPGNGNLYWYENPGGAAARTQKWNSFYIGGCNEGISLDTGNFSGTSQSVIVASNEQEPAAWTPGMVLYTATSNLLMPWSKQSLDSTTRDVHQLDYVTLGGLPGLVRGEQEQASPVCNTRGYNDHIGVSGCRVDLWLYNKGSWTVTPMSNRGTHNAYCMPYNGGLLCVGANHHIYGGPPAVNAWVIAPGVSGPPGGGLNPGLYTIADPAGFVIDGGFFGTHGDTAERLYQSETPHNPYQGWNVSATGTICNEELPSACLSDGGSSLDIGVATDSWTFAASGAGYTVQNTGTGSYIADAATPTDGAPIPVSKNTSVWSFSLVNPPAGGFTPGTYSIDDPSKSQSIDGGFYYWQGQTNEETYQVGAGNVFQQWAITASGAGYTICNMHNTSLCLSDNGSTLQIAVGADTFTITASGSGYTILDQQSGNYIDFPTPLANSAVVHTSKTPAVLSIGPPQ